jgi:hypothetical protein
MSREDGPNLRQIPICKCCTTCEDYEKDCWLCRRHDFQFDGDEHSTVCDDWN